MDHYLSTNRINEAISSLEVVIDNFNHVKVDKSRWKWIIIATHNSLQNIMVEALWFGNGFQAMSKKSVKKWMVVHQEESGNKKYPALQLATFPELYKRICDKAIMEGYYHSKAFTAEQRHNHAIYTLNKIRNIFIHFELTSWSLNINDIPNIITDCIDVLKFLVHNSNNILIENPQDKDRLNKSIDELIYITHEINNDICGT